MRVKFWGTRGTRPTPGRNTLRYGGNTACVEVRTKSDDLIIIDSGSGICELGNALGGPVNAHLLISHTHWDHIQGFPFFGPNFARGSKLTVIGPRGSMKSLQSAFADQMDPVYFPLTMDQMPVELEFKEMAAGDTFEAAGVRVTPHSMHHPIATFGYRLEENGSTFVFATDQEPYDDPEDLARKVQAIREAGGSSEEQDALWRDRYIDWCRGADLLVHDAQYSAEEYRHRVGWGHSSFDYALLVARQAGARQLAFYHHEPMHSDHQIEAMVEEALGSEAHRRHRGLIAFPAAEGQEIVL
ncbi:MAG: MBL fold metallo-hydrolase [Candidatus Dormibacteraceae bacterium]